MKILTAARQFTVRKAGGYRRWVAREAERRWGVDVHWETRGVVHAEVIRSAWAARCPFCGGAMVVEPGEPFVDVDCMMQGNGFFAMAVAFPANRAEIEAVLRRRPDPATRNWLIGETVDELRRENAAHGLEG